MKVVHGQPVGRATAVASPRRAAARPETAAALRAGDITSIAGLSEAELTPAVRAAVLRLMQEVEQLRADLEQARRRNEHLERLADEDPLLPIVNRRAFVRELSRMLAFARRHGSPSTLIYSDVNGMKKINDTFGHAAGDAVLRHVAGTLVRSVRQSDAVGRLGGDEFGVLLGQADAQAGLMKAERLAATVAAVPVIWDGHTITPTLSCGVYTFRGDEAVDAALELADSAMYAQKRRTRDVPEEPA